MGLGVGVGSGPVARLDAFEDVGTRQVEPIVEVAAPAIVSTAIVSIAIVSIARQMRSPNLHAAWRGAWCVMHGVAGLGGTVVAVIAPAELAEATLTMAVLTTAPEEMAEPIGEAHAPC